MRASTVGTWQTLKQQTPNSRVSGCVRKVPANLQDMLLQELSTAKFSSSIPSHRHGVGPLGAKRGPEKYEIVFESRMD